MGKRPIFDTLGDGKGACSLGERERIRSSRPDQKQPPKEAGFLRGFSLLFNCAKKRIEECQGDLTDGTDGLVQALCEHAAGNLRLLMNMANDLLAAASHQERERIDEKLYFEVFALDPKPSRKP
jgi:hypothetical protein